MISYRNDRGNINYVFVGYIAITLVIVGVLVIVWLVPYNDKINSIRGRGDAPVQLVDSAPRKVYELPDRFSNVAMFCDEYGNEVYVTTKTTESQAMFALKDGCE